MEFVKRPKILSIACVFAMAVAMGCQKSGGANQSAPPQKAATSLPVTEQTEGEGVGDAQSVAVAQADDASTADGQSTDKPVADGPTPHFTSQISVVGQTQSSSTSQEKAQPCAPAAVGAPGVNSQSGSTSGEGQSVDADFELADRGQAEMFNEQDAASVKEDFDKSSAQTAKGEDIVPESTKGQIASDDANSNKPSLVNPYRGLIGLTQSNEAESLIYVKYLRETPVKVSGLGYERMRMRSTCLGVALAAADIVKAKSSSRVRKDFHFCSNYQPNIWFHIRAPKLDAILRTLSQLNPYYQFQFVPVNAYVMKIKHSGDLKSFADEWNSASIAHATRDLNRAPVSISAAAACAIYWPGVWDSHADKKASTYSPTQFVLVPATL